MNESRRSIPMKQVQRGAETKASHEPGSNKRLSSVVVARLMGLESLTDFSIEVETSRIMPPLNDHPSLRLSRNGDEYKQNHASLSGGVLVVCWRFSGGCDSVLEFFSSEKIVFVFTLETLQDFGTLPIFKRTFSQDLDLLEKHLSKDILSQTDCKTTLKNLRTQFENAFNSEFKERMHQYTRFNAQSFKAAMISSMDSIGKYMLEIILHQQRTPHLLKQTKLMQTQEDHSNPIRALNVDSLKVNSIFIQNPCSETEDSNSETASSKSVKESSLDSETKDVHAIKYKMSKAKARCMKYFRSLHSHLQVLSKEDLKGTRIEHGFKRAFMSLFGQDADTFTSTMLLNVDHLQMQLEKAEFQKDGSMTAFWGYDRRENKILMHMQDSKIDMGKAVNDDLVVTESSGTESEVQDDNSRSGNDTDADDADIRPIYDEEPMAK
nr:protein longifolia 2-like [Tanacetum cinerariifolium]